MHFRTTFIQSRNVCPFPWGPLYQRFIVTGVAKYLKAFTSLGLSFQANNNLLYTFIQFENDQVLFLYHNENGIDKTCYIHILSPTLQQNVVIIVYITNVFIQLI